MTGIMINTVPHRVQLDPQATVIATLQEIQSRQIEISKHENISLAEIQSGDIAVSGLFQTILNFRNKGFSDIINGGKMPVRPHLFTDNRPGAHGG